MQDELTSPFEEISAEQLNKCPQRLHLSATVISTSMSIFRAAAFSKTCEDSLRLELN